VPLDSVYRFISQHPIVSLLTSGGLVSTLKPALKSFYAFRDFWDEQHCQFKARFEARRRQPEESSLPGRQLVVRQRTQP